MKKQFYFACLAFVFLFLLAAGKSHAQCAPNFSWTQTNPNELTFANTTSGTFVNPVYTWTFGDNTAYSGVTPPAHIYNVPGSYTVCLTVYDSLTSCMNTFCDTVNVTGTLICNFQVTVNPVNASCPTCTDGSAGAALSNGTGPYTYAWSSGNTSAFDAGLAVGTYTLCVTDANNCTACDTFNITGCSVSASFTWAQTNPNEITFTNTSPSGYQYSWAFGDNTTDNTQNPPPHIYMSPGTYTTTLTVTDTANNCSNYFSDTVNVTGTVLCNFLLLVTWQSPTCGTCNDGIAWASSSGGTAPFSFNWSSGGTSSMDVGLAVGTYTLCVTDAMGCVACDTFTVDTCNINASFTWTQTNPNEITFTNTSIQPGTYCTWSFGDNTPQYTGTTPPPHIYNVPGTYSACLTTHDSATTCTTTYCDTMVTVTGSVICNLQLSLSGANPSCLSCTDGQGWASVWGGTGPYTYLWSSGGTSSMDMNLVVGPNVLCATDANNCTICDTLWLTAGGCNATFLIYPDVANAGNYIAVNQSTGTGTMSYMWDWGDGTFSYVAFPSHTYNTPGYYNICLYITDSAGCSDMHCFSIQALALDPDVWVAMTTVNVISSPTGIAEKQETSLWELYPNPVNDQLTLNRIQPGCTFTISDVLGKTHAGGKLMGNVISTAELPGGVYLLTLTNAKGKHTVKRFVKN
jgi:PKD repeat protein